jgi:hypothetical protein
MLYITFLINLVGLQYSAVLTNSVNCSSAGEGSELKFPASPCPDHIAAIGSLREATWLVRVCTHGTATHSCPHAVLAIRLKPVVECRLGQTHRLILAGRCCPVMESISPTGIPDCI